MKFREILRFEMVYQLSRPATWIYFGAVLGLTLMVVMSYTDNAKSGEAYMNSPLIVAGIAAFSNMFALLLIAGLAGDSAIRDLEARMDPLLYTTSLDKWTFLGGHYLGTCLSICMLMLPMVPLALLASSFMPGVEQAYFGPIMPLGFLSAYSFFTLPSIFAVTALLYSLVLLSRQALLSYIGALLLFISSAISMDLLAGPLGLWELSKLTDPAGYTVVKELRQVWAPLKLQAGLIPFEGWLMANRLLWLGIGFGFFTIAFMRFRFAYNAGNGGWRWKKSTQNNNAALLTPHAPIAVPLVSRTFNIATRLRQIIHMSLQFFLEFVSVWSILALLVLVYLLCQVIPELMEGPLGVPLIPTTANVITTSSHTIIRSLLVMLIIICVAQLVWRERDARLHDLMDAAPVPDAILLISKYMALVLLILAFQTVLVLTGMGIQASLGYYHFEPGLYLQIFYGIQLVDYLLIALAAIALQVLVNQKYVGLVIMLLFYAYTVVPEEFGINHKLLVYGSDTGWSMSAMSNINSYVVPWLLFKLYWVGWAIIFGVAARLFWVRGREFSLLQRFHLARLRTTQPVVLLSTAAFITIAATGVCIFYNTNVLNEYRQADEADLRRAVYERRYGRYHGVPQPLLTSISLHVEIYPEQQEVVVKGSYQLQNTATVAIDTIHLATASEVETTAFNFGQKAKEILRDEALGHWIYALEEPLKPGDSLLMSFQVVYRKKGFSNWGITSAVTKRHTFFHDREWMPAIGYQPDQELKEAADRKKHGLVHKQAYPSLDDEEARQNRAGREQIQFEAVIGTAGDQIAVAPGALLKSWVAQGRHYYHYKTSNPIRNGYAILSAPYAVHERQWGKVKLSIYHHPADALNLNRMMQGMQTALAYHSRNFGPYPQTELKMVQYAGHGSLTSFSGLITFPESFAHMNPDADSRNIDLPYAVVAHEVAHQWWGNQLVPAYVEGASLISESLAWYSALAVVQEAYGHAHLQRLLEVMRGSYLTPRSKADVPLLRATNHFLAYRKGPFAMNALREYMGEEKINLALEKLLKDFLSGEPPLPTSLNLYAELQRVTADSLKPLLSDLFETNTYWELETKHAQAERMDNGQWLVSLTVAARKVQVDADGMETEIPMNDLIEVGVFGTEVEEKTGIPLYLNRHRIHSGKQQIIVKVQGKPAMGGIDPRNLLIDTEMYDNVKQVLYSKKKQNGIGHR